jgi:hypothetical protein
MKQVKIDLARPFEEIAAKLRSIPPTDNFINRNDTVCEPSSKVEEVLRSIYEAANGRTVATQIGLITIAPPTAAFLKDAPFFVETQADFLLQALARLYSGSCRGTGIRPRGNEGEITNRNTEFRRPSSLGRRSISHAIR